jgi:serine/threonine protein phosphatase 1
LEAATSVLITADPHGCFLTFEKLYRDMTARFPGEPFIVAGDIPDRGPRTRQLIQFLIDNKIHCLQGNHDLLMWGSRETPAIWEPCWFRNGGLRALQSYCRCHVAPERMNRDRNPHICPAMPILAAHRVWLKALPLYFDLPHLKHTNGRPLMITHAPIFMDEIPIDQLARHENFVWNNVYPPRQIEWFNVHGHLPRVDGPQITEWFANIDSGCVFPEEPGLGKMTCLRFPSMEVFQQPYVD